MSISEPPTQVSHHQGVVCVVHHRPGHSYGGLHPAETSYGTHIHGRPRNTLGKIDFHQYIDVTMAGVLSS